MRNKNRRTKKIHRKRKEYLRRKNAQLEVLEPRQMLTSAWHNTVIPEDVNGDSFVSPIDVLIVVREANLRQYSGVDGRLPDIHEAIPAYLDVNGDMHVTAADAGIVIDQITFGQAGRAASILASAEPLSGVPVELFPNGPETLVNTTTKRTQLSPSASAFSPNGQLVVVWGSDDNGGRGVYGQRYNLLGQKVAGEFLVNTTQKDSQSTPAVSVATDGSFVVAWSDNSTKQNGWDVFAQQYAADGSKIGDAWQVNETISGNQRYPAVAHSEDGSFAITWEGAGPGDNDGVFVRVFDSVGAATSSDTSVNDVTSGSQGAPSIAATVTGYAIVWSGQSTADSKGIQLRQISSVGVAEGIALQVNANSQGNQEKPSITSHDDGRLLVAWESSNGDGHGNGIFAREFDASSTPILGPLLINETTQGNQEAPSVDYLTDGGFAVTWNGKGKGDVQGVYVRTFDDEGVATSNETLVNETTQSTQDDSIIVGMGSRAVVVWQGRGVGDTDGIYSRLYGVVPRLGDLPDQTINEHELLQLTISSVGDVEFWLDDISLGLGASIDLVSGEYRWTPSEVQGPGEYVIEVTVRDQQDPTLVDTKSFTVTVLEVNSPPTLILPAELLTGPLEIQVGDSVLFMANATDEDIPANGLVYSLAGLVPDGATISANSGDFLWMPTVDQIGEHVVTVTVTDDGIPNLSDMDTITVIVIPSNNPPILQIDDVVVDEEQLLTLSIVASDPDGDSVELSLTDEIPLGVDFDPLSGELRWTPTEKQGPGLYPITVVATDSGSPQLSTTATFTVTVNEVNRPPVLELPDAVAQPTVQLDVGEELQFTATASDPDIPANGLTFSLVGDAPAGATIDPTTGEFAWTPTADQDGGQYSITVRVNDDGTPELDDTDLFEVSVGACAFDEEFNNWSFGESGGSTAGHGTVTASGCNAVLTEGDSFATYLETSFIVPETSDDLSVTFSGISFDTSDEVFINDAFEMSLVDQNGNSLVGAFEADRDAFFNITESLTPEVALGTSQSGGTITVDTSGVTPGTAATLTLRLVNNDSDTATNVTITEFSIPGFGDQPTPVVLDPISLARQTSFASTTVGQIGNVDDGFVVETSNEFLSMSAVSPYASLPAGTAFVVSGTVGIQGDSINLRSVVQITANGTAVELVDAANNFFTTLELLPGENHIELSAVDSVGNSVTTSMTITGTQPQEKAIDLGRLVDVSAYFDEEYGRTTFEEQSKQLSVELTSHNAGNFSIGSPLLAGFKNISDPTVSLVDADGVFPDGTPFIDISDSILGSELTSGGSTESRIVSFFNPTRMQFDYDVVYFGQLNAAPYFTTIPVVEAIVGKDYAYDSDATDPEGDPLQFEMPVGPQSLNESLNSDSGLMNWTPTPEDVGNHAVTVVVADDHGNTAEQSFVISVIDSPPNRPPVFVTDPVTVANYERVDTNVEPVILSSETTTFYDFGSAYGSQSPARWTYPDASTAYQSVNARPSALLLNEPLTQEVIEGSLLVNTTGDDDFIGFVFGWQDPSHFYLFSWKQRNQSGFGDAGMFVKVMDTDGTLPSDAHWGVGDRDGATELYRNEIGWKDRVTYTFRLEYGGDGEFTITVKEGEDVVDSFTIIDDTYSSGQFGFYNQSQDSVRYRGFVRTAVDEPTYTYDSEAVDPDQDPITYGLMTGPDGMQIDAETGVIDWRPSESQLLGSAIAPDPSLPSVPGFDVEKFVSIPDPGQMTFDGFGDIFVGRSSSDGRLPWQLRKVSEGSVQRATNTKTSDPDSVYYDVSGEFSGVPGSVLVGGLETSGDAGKISAVHPDGTVTTVVGPSTAVGNVTSMQQDPLGRLLFVGLGDTSNINVLVDGQIQTLASVPGFVTGLAVSPSGIIYAGFDGGRIRTYDLDGNLVDDNFATNSGASPRFSMFSQGGDWGRDLYVLDDGTGKITRFDSTGASTLIGTGFEGATELAFGPEGSMYVASQARDRIIKVSPTRQTLGLAPNEHLVTAVASDGRGGVATQTYVVAVKGAIDNHDPVFVSQPLTVAIAEATTTSYQYQATAVDADRDDLRFALTGTVPSGMSIDSNSGVIEWAPATGQVGDHTISLLVSDGRGGFDEQVFTITVRSLGTAQILGTVFADVDADGIRDAEDVGLADQLLYLDQNANRRFDIGEVSTTSGTDGSYSFLQLPAEDYLVRYAPMAGFTQTAPVLGSYQVTVSDGQVAAGLDVGSFQIVSAANSAPSLGVVPADRRVATIGELYRFDVEAVDRESDSLTFSMAQRPDGMTFDAGTGTIVWTPRAEQLGTHNVLIQVTDDGGRSDSLSYSIEVVAQNNAPIIISTPPTQAAIGQPLKYQLVAQDLDLVGGTLSYRTTITPPPTGAAGDMQIDDAGLLTWTPPAAQLGTNPQVQVVVTDEQGAETEQTFTLEVVSLINNRLPRITSEARTRVQVGQRYSYLVQAEDDDSDPISVQLIQSPAGMTIENGLLLWDPTGTQLGAHLVTIQVSDGRGAPVVQQFEIDVVVQGSNVTPTIVSTPRERGRVDKVYAYDLEARDRDGDPVFWTLDSGPAGMSIDPLMGTLRWIPGLSNVGRTEVTVRATDPYLAFATQTFEVDVTCVNGHPNITSVPPTEAVTGTELFYSVRAVDPDGDRLTFDMPQHLKDLGMLVDANGLWRWTPTRVGSQQVSIKATDPDGATATQQFTIEALDGGTPEGQEAANRTPVITSLPGFFAAIDVPYNYDVAAFDADGDVLTFSLSNPPFPTVTIDGTSGLVSWTPTADQSGSHLLTVVVSDGIATSTQTFGLEVQANQDPTINSSPVDSVLAGALYQYDLRASDPEGDDLGYELLDAPPGMTVDRLGRIFWDAPVLGITNANVAVQVSDTRGGLATQAFSVTVIPDTEAPVVAIQTTIGSFQTYGNSFGELDAEIRFTVSASDNAGVEEITFMVDGEAIGLDTLGRAIYDADTGGLKNVVATATDLSGNVGVANVELRIIDWQADGGPAIEITSPTEDDEITNVTPIIGSISSDTDVVDFYRVYMGRADKVNPQQVNLADPDYSLIQTGTGAVVNDEIASFDPTLLSNDSYVIVVSAFDQSGRVSYESLVLNVEGNAKLGNFTLSFTDLAIPLEGIPVEVTRIYDTLNNNVEGDFGYGWTLGTQDPRLREVLAVGGSGFNGPSNTFIPGVTRVYMNLPSGQRAGFTYQERLVSISLFGGIWEPYFESPSGITETLSIDEGVVYRGGIVGAFGSGVNPDTYTLTTKDGLEYRYDQFDGLQTITDRNENIVSFDSDGISHSSGVSIDYVRDHRGRIEKIIDPDGDETTYTYDAIGDLERVTNAEDLETRFVYLSNPAHYLDEVYDAMGRRTLKAEYDAENRFIGVIDAFGNRVDQRRYELDDSRAVIVDGNGNETTIIYDDRGNVVEEIDPLGNSTIRQYQDPRHPDLETTIIDRRGFETNYLYDSRGNALRITDAGSVTRFDYNTFGQVTSITGPAESDPGDGYADTLVDSFFVGGAVTGLTVREDIVSDVNRVFDSAEVILGAEFDRNTEVPYDADHIWMAPGDYVTVAFDEVVVDRPGPDLYVITPWFAYGFNREGRKADVAVTVDGSTFIDVGQTGEEGTNPIDLADFGITDEVLAVRVTATDAGSGGYVLTAVRATTGEFASTHFDYDNSGNLTSITNALGDSSAFTYDNRGRRSTFTDFNGNTTSFAYSDPNQPAQPSRVTFADATYQTFAYTTEGQVTEEAYYESDDTLVEIRATDFDDLGRVLEERIGLPGDPDHPQTVVRKFYDGQQLDWEAIISPDSLDPNGNLLESPDTPIVNRKSRITDFEYDAKDQLIRQIDAEGGVVDFRYDNNGNRIALRDPVGNITTWLYDKNNNIQEERDPFYWVEARAADAVLSALTDDEYLERITPIVPVVPGNAGDTRDPLYDDPSGGNAEAGIGADHVRVFGYDEEENQAIMIDRNGRRREFDYDFAARLEEERWYAVGSGPLVETANFAYDEKGNMLTASDSKSNYVFTYDLLNRLETVDNNPDGTRDVPRVVLTYSYDAQGNVTLTQDDAGVTVESQYNPRNQLQWRKWFDADAGGDVDDARVDFQYNAVGRESGIQRYSDLDATTRVGSTTRTYDQAGRSDSLRHDNPVGALLAGYDYDYEFSGLLTHEQRSHQDAQFAQGIEYTYDLTGQLTDALFGGQDDEHYVYDGNGNRITSEVGSDQRTYTTAPANQLESDARYRYEYDGEGNQIKRLPILLDGADDPSGTVRTFIYDHRNRLVQVDDWSSDPGDPQNPVAGAILTQSVEYTYDALGRRIAREVDRDGAGPLTREKELFVYNGDNVWADHNASGEVDARYAFGNGIDRNLARFREIEGTAWYLTDRLGSIHDSTNLDGTIINHNEFASFGKVLSQSASQFGDRFLFAAREYDAPLDSYFYRARQLTPDVGRFWSEDPVRFNAGDPNLNRALFNSPTNGTDPKGTSLVGDAVLFGVFKGIQGAISGGARGILDCGGIDADGNIHAELQCVGPYVANGFTFGLTGGIIAGLLGASFPLVPAAVFIDTFAGIAAGQPEFQEALTDTAEYIASQLGISGVHGSSAAIKSVLNDVIAGGNIGVQSFGKIVNAILKDSLSP